jgi:serine/threonine protein phosphatase PrpC
VVHDEEIGKILATSDLKLEDASAKLIEAANEAGGRDNVTVVLLRRPQ